MAWTSTGSTQLDLPNGAKVYEGTFDAICGNFAHLGGTSGAQWVDWTPTVNQGGAVAVTVNYAKYVKIGYLAHTLFAVTATAAGTSGNNIIVGGIPAAITPASGHVVVGNGYIAQTGAGFYLGTAVLTGTTGILFYTGVFPASIVGSGAYSMGSSDVISAVCTWRTT